jgi:hypothetical protein
VETIGIVKKEGEGNNQGGKEKDGAFDEKPPRELTTCIDRFIQETPGFVK